MSTLLDPHRLLRHRRLQCAQQTRGHPLGGDHQAAAEVCTDETDIAGRHPCQLEQHVGDGDLLGVRRGTAVFDLGGLGCGQSQCTDIDDPHPRGPFPGDGADGVGGDHDRHIGHGRGRGVHRVGPDEQVDLAGQGTVGEPGAGDDPGSGGDRLQGVLLGRRRVGVDVHPGRDDAFAEPGDGRQGVHHGGAAQQGTAAGRAASDQNVEGVLRRHPSGACGAREDAPVTAAGEVGGTHRETPTIRTRRHWSGTVSHNVPILLTSVVPEKPHRR